MNPQRTRVKICGMTNTSDINAAVTVGSDAIGVICDVPVDTPRDVSRTRAAELIAAVPPFVTSVLVTMPTNESDAIELIDTLQPDAVQLHGVDSLSMINAIRDHCSVIVALDATDAETVHAIDAVADMLLLDSTDEQGAGGTGETTDWERAHELVNAVTTPVVLAGGLTPENVADAVSAVRPFGVDVASGVEGNDGKDHDAIAQFVRRAVEAT